MDYTPADPPPSLSTEAPSPDSVEKANRSSTPRSRATSDSAADVWIHQEHHDTSDLPAEIASLGEGLNKALNSDGGVSEAYSAFADKAFSHPALVPAASRFIARLFAGQQGVLINLVRTKDLLAALEHGSSEFPRMIAVRWQAGAMTQRIARFGESLVFHKDQLKNAASAEVLAAFAGLLAIHKPERASTLFQLAKDITDAPGGQDFVEDVQAWLQAGRLIESLSVEDRAFWQQRLRFSEADEEWASPEARRALDALAGRLRPEMPCAVLFEAVVPASWWQAHINPNPAKAAIASLTPAPENGSPIEGRPAPAKSQSSAGEASSGSLVPSGPKAMAAEPVSFAVEAATGKVTSSPRSLPVGALVFLSGQLFGMVLMAVIWALQPDLLPRTLAAGGPHEGEKRQIATHGPTPLVSRNASSLESSSPGQPASAGQQWRTREVEALVATHASLKPWVLKAQTGTWDECSSLVTGHHASAFPAEPDYRTFLRWLILDPAHDPEIRRAVPRLYARIAPIPDLIELCQNLSYAASPNAADMPTMAEIALDVQSAVIKPDERRQLAKMVGTSL